MRERPRIAALRMAADYFLLVIRWMHAVAAVAWVGGALFYWFALRPALRGEAEGSGVGQRAGREFGQVVLLAMWVLAVTGGILAVQRLSEASGGVAYASVLAVKVALAAWMFSLALSRVSRRRGADAPRRGRLGVAMNALGHVNTTAALGLVVIFLSAILRFLVEEGAS